MRHEGLASCGHRKLAGGPGGSVRSRDGLRYNVNIRKVEKESVECVMVDTERVSTTVKKPVESMVTAWSRRGQWSALHFGAL
jgi:hypothetical protein